LQKSKTVERRKAAD
jgi:FKBP12-rapamycin complex-associated protein